MNIPDYFQLNQFENNINKQKSYKFRYPVDLQKCERHRKANLICKIFSQDIKNIKKKDICKCCGRIKGDQPIKKCLINTQEYAKYGPGIPLYFLFFKAIIYLLLGYFLLFGIWAVISNFMSHDCSKHKKCASNILGMQISFMNSYQQSNITLYQLIDIFVLIFISLFAFIYIYHILKDKKKQLDNAITSPSDFAMILRRLPKGTQQKDIQFMINQYRQFLNPVQRADTNNLKVHKILFAYDIQQYEQIEALNLQNFKKCCENQQEFIERQLPDITQKLSTAIVIFQKQKSRSLFTGHLSFIQKLKRRSWFGYQPLSQIIKVKNQYVSVQRAPQPDDIIWRNQGLSLYELFYKKLAIFILSLNLLLISAMIQYYLGSIRTHSHYDDPNVQRLFSLASAGLITLINFAIECVLIYSSKIQRPNSQTLLKISMIYKLVFMQFINSGVISILIASSIYQSFRYYKSFICNDILYIMVMNAISNNVFNFLLVYLQIPNRLYRYQMKKKWKIFTQLQANKIYEANEVDIEYKYAYIFKTIWLTVFFMPAQPAVIFASILGLIINYWSEKYLFSGFYTIPNMFSGRISNAVLDLLKYTSFWMIMGSFYFHLSRVNFIFKNIPFQYLVFHVIGVIISLIIMYAPLSSIAYRFFGEISNQYSFQKSYQIEQQNFQLTYQALNPAYSKDEPKHTELDKLGYHLTNFLFDKSHNIK